MKKPKQHKRNPTFDYMEIMEYVEEKYKTQELGSFNDAWHWMVFKFEPDNGSDIYIRAKEMEKTEKDPYMKVMLGHLHTEFGEEITCTVSW